MSSGAFFPASLIHKAAVGRMEALVSFWKIDAEDDVQKRIKIGRWSWWFFRRVPLTREEAISESTLWTLKRYILEHPMENRYYAAAAKLAATAREVMDLDEEATMFVSTTDFHNIRKYYAKAEVKEIIA